MSVTIDTSRIWTYDDLLAFPEDNVRREIIDGELIVTPSPSTRHQRAVLELGAALLAYVKERGGEVFVAPMDVWFTGTDVVEPDVLFIRPERVDRVEHRRIRGAPDLVCEVSSPSTRRIDIVRKRRLYEREGVAEYWFVDLDADRVEVYRLTDAGYGDPTFLGRGELATTPRAPEFAVAVDDLLGEEPSGS
jgi:Uma2 family endonuclease